MTTIRRLAGAVFNREFALAIGGIASAVAFVAGEITGDTVWVDGNLGQTLLNLIPKLGFLATGAAIRFRVWSKASVEKIQEEAAVTGETPPLPTPP